MEKTASCRGCGMKLDGKPYYMGGEAYHPITKKKAKVNHYGGFVCSERCDFDSSLSLERSMPGHDSSQVSLGMFSEKHHKSNWA